MTETIAYLIAGLLAAVLKAYFSADQATFSRKSVADVIIGGAVGLLYPLFPLVPLPAGASLIQRAAIVLVICYVSTDLLQNVLGKIGIAMPSGTPKPALAWVLLPLLGVTALTGCSTISANPAQDLRAEIAAKPADSGAGLFGKVVMQGLLDATYNLDNAVTVGALDATDPAPKCFHGILGQLGIDPAVPTTPAPSFTPRRSDLISEGSILYIRARQAQKLAGQGVTVPSGCKELVAQFMLDAAAAGIKAQPGGGLLPLLR